MSERYYVLNEFPEDEENFIDALEEVGCPQSLLDKATRYFRVGFCELQNLVTDGKALATKLRGLGVTVKVRKLKRKKIAPRREQQQQRRGQRSRGEKRRIPLEAPSLSRRGALSEARVRRTNRMDEHIENRLPKRSRLASRDQMQRLIEIERQKGPKPTRSRRREEAPVRNPLLIVPSKRNYMQRNVPRKRNIVPSRLPNNVVSKKNLLPKKTDTSKKHVEEAQEEPPLIGGDEKDDIIPASKSKLETKVGSKSKNELSEERKELLKSVKTAPLEGLDDNKLRQKVARNICQVVAKSSLSECSLEAVLPIGLKVELAMWDTTRGGDEEDELYRRRVRQFLFNLRSNMELMESVLQADEKILRELVVQNNESLAKSSLKKDREKRQYDFTPECGSDLYECPNCGERNAQLICQGVVLCHRADQEIIKCLVCQASFKAND